MFTFLAVCIVTFCIDINFMDLAYLALWTFDLFVTDKNSCLNPTTVDEVPRRCFDKLYLSFSYILSRNLCQENIGEILCPANGRLSQTIRNLSNQQQIFAGTFDKDFYDGTKERNRICQSATVY